MFGLITRRSYLAHSSSQENTYLQQQNNRYIVKTSLYHLQFSSCVSNYAQNGIHKSHCDVCFGPYLIDLSSHVALTKKRKISDSRAFIWCAQIVRICCILFELCLMKKKKEEEERRKKNNKIEIFTFNFVDCEEKSWDSGAIFDIRIANCFHLHV